MRFFPIWQALNTLKKGTQLLKYGRKGKPKFYPFRLSSVSCFLLSTTCLCAIIFFWRVSSSEKTMLVGVGYAQDEKSLIWISSSGEKRLKLASVSKIVPGQRTVRHSSFLYMKRIPLGFQAYLIDHIIYCNRLFSSVIFARRKITYPSLFYTTEKRSLLTWLVIMKLIL